MHLNRDQKNPWQLWYFWCLSAVKTEAFNSVLKYDETKNNNLTYNNQISWFATSRFLKRFWDSSHWKVFFFDTLLLHLFLPHWLSFKYIDGTYIYIIFGQIYSKEKYRETQTFEFRLIYTLLFWGVVSFLLTCCSSSLM